MRDKAMKTFLIRGVPVAMQRDGWWMNGPSASPLPKEVGMANRPKLLHLGLLVTLIALGDVLVWQVAPGVSLALFGAALMTAAMGLASKKVSGQTLALVAGGSILTLLPLVELVQPLSILIAVCGISALLVVLAGVSPNSVFRGMLRLWPLGLQQTVSDGINAFGTADAKGLPDLLRRIGLSWFFPLSLGMVFVALLLAANPVADQWALNVLQVDLSTPSPNRIVFWFCLLPWIWTALSLPRLQERLWAAPAARKFGPKKKGLINVGSTTRALIMFNLVFAAQTVLDFIYLYGGAGLPEGITYAEYAHRGAYPLLVTALLAGAFALLTRQWTNGSTALRALLMLFVAQNVALVGSSLFRLSLYVEVYGLTHMRLAAAIWMGLVAVGLLLVLFQVWKDYANPWMLGRAAAIGALVLYACAFVSFDAVIARYSIAHETKRDLRYMCRLGDAAWSIILAHEQAVGRTLCHRRADIQAPNDWREWGFRNARARNSLAALQQEAPL
jgi:hypothetical protein